MLKMNTNCSKGLADVKFIFKTFSSHFYLLALSRSIVASIGLTFLLYKYLDFYKNSS